MDLLKQNIKHNPEDFVVEEVMNLNLKKKGRFSYYLLWKKGRNTLDVLLEISEKLNIPLYKFGFSGLKDKRAVTLQYVSIEGGPKRGLRGKGWRLKFLGCSEKGIEIGEALGNRFTITIRNVDVGRVIYNLGVIKDIGFANYFGEQRFLSDRYTSKPMAVYLLRGDFGTALKEYFTQSPNLFMKKRLRSLWGRWRDFLEEAQHLSRQERVAIKVLERTKDPEKAFRAFPKNLKLMFFFSYQSLLWNRMLSRIVSKGPHFKVPFVKGQRIAFYKEESSLIDELLELDIPYVSSEAMDGDFPYKEELVRIVEEEGIRNLLDTEVTSLKVFNPGTRRAAVKPEDLEVLYQDRNSVTVRFFLPSGAYATVLVRKAVFM